MFRKDKYKLTHLVTCAGWASKLGPADLEEILHLFPATSNPNILVGLETHDDAGIIRISEDQALIQTVDFFTPIVDDPYDFGQIEAANSLSDIYAMGGTPATGLNIVSFPDTRLDKEILARILIGGYDKTQEAGVVILGGHSIKDPELKYGLAITGFISPEEIIRNSTAKVGDRLILTKPLGTGILATALKRGKLPDDILKIITDTMKRLNKTASQIMKKHQANACTDITGFGFIGHLYEIVQSSHVSARIEADTVPLFPATEEFARKKKVPGGLIDNRNYVRTYIKQNGTLDSRRIDVFFDPQTSGGLLMAIPEDRAEACLTELRSAGETEAAIVGEIIPRGDYAIEIV